MKVTGRQDYHKLLLEEVLRYLYLLAENPNKVTVSPSDVVDKGLHCLLLDPQLYARISDELMNLRGKLSTDFPLRALPHDPLGGDMHCEQQARQVLTHNNYAPVFGVPPPALFWPVIQPERVSVWFGGKKLVSCEVDMAKNKGFGVVAADDLGSVVLINHYGDDKNVTLFISDVTAPRIYVESNGYH
eukprot:gene637-844_t